MLEDQEARGNKKKKLHCAFRHCRAPYQVQERKVGEMRKTYRWCTQRKLVARNYNKERDAVWPSDSDIHHFEQTKGKQRDIRIEYGHVKEDSPRVDTNGLGV
jgi:hypothetical protein